jgi:hypothetical protein
MRPSPVAGILRYGPGSRLSCQSAARADGARLERWPAAFGQADEHDLHALPLAVGRNRGPGSAPSRSPRRLRGVAPQTCCPVKGRLKITQSFRGDREPTDSIKAPNWIICVLIHRARPTSITRRVGDLAHPRVSTSAHPRTFHGVAGHEWRCWPLHKNAMAELAHIGRRVRSVSG